MTSTEADTHPPLRAPSRDSLEFAAGFMLGIAAGIGLGLALVTPRGTVRARRVIRRLGRG